MIKKIFSLAALALALASCVNDLDIESRLPVQDGADDEIFYATLEGEDDAAAETKVYADSKVRVLWNADDRISIFRKTTGNEEFKFTGADGANAGSFTRVSGEKSSIPLPYFYAIYPYATANAVSEDGIVSLSLRSTQTYKENSFGIGANKMVSVTSSNHLMFRNVGSFLSFKFYGSGVAVKRIILKGNNHEKIAGAAKVTMDLNGMPTVQMQDNATESITLTCKTAVPLGATAANATEFWFVLPPTDFTKGITVTVIDDNDGVFEMNSSAHLTFERNKLTRLSAKKVTPTHDYVAFADDNFKAYCVTNFDTNHDGKISFAEALVVEAINVNTDNITSLGGIEHFTSLTHLTCNGTHQLNQETYQYDNLGQLTNVDLSQNTALTNVSIYSNKVNSVNVGNCFLLKSLSLSYNCLTSLDVSNNTNLTILAVGGNQLNNLDISNNHKIESLYCWENQLTNLKVSHLAGLKQIWAQNNQLSTLDVSKNTALDALSCAYNKLSTLNVSNNTALTHLSCYYNQLTSLNISNNTALETLQCSDNQLTNLDISKNAALKTLSCGYNQLTNLTVSHNTALTALRCQRCQLSSLDVSKNTALTQIACDYNSISGLNLTNCTALTELQCSNNQLSGLDVSKNTELTLLRCGNNPMTSLDVSNNLKLQTLDCYSYSTTPLAEIWLTVGQEIPRFSYNYNTVLKYKGDDTPLVFVNAKFKDWCITQYDDNGDGEISVAETLGVTDMNVNTDNISSLEDIGHFQNLRYLTCTGSTKWDSGLSQSVAQGQLTSLDVSANTKLISLYCSHNQLTSLVVSKNTELWSLDCSDNKLSSLDVSKNTKLESLSCEENQITTLDVSNNPALTVFWCQHNLLSNLDVSNNTALESFSCSYNQLKSLNLSKNTALTSLSCFFNQLTTLDLSKNTALTSVSCWKNNLNSLVIDKCTALSNIDCYGNPLTSLDVSKNTALTRLSCTTTQIASLDVSNNPNLDSFCCYSCPLLKDIWLKTGQTFSLFLYDEDIATLHYK